MSEIYIAPWSWRQSDSGFFEWAPPIEGAVGILDMRSIPQQSRSGGVPEGRGVFVYPSAASVPGATALGGDLDRTLDASERQQLEGTVNFNLRSGTSVRDFLWFVFTEGSDPTGLTGPKPLMPTVEGRLELHLGGFSVIKSERFDVSSHPHAAKVIATVQENYRRISNEASGQEVHLKYLGAMVRKYRIRDPQLLVPEDMPFEGVRTPETTLNESFNKPDSDTLGPDQTWVEISGDTDVVSGKAESQTAGDNRSYVSTPLSSDDHYSQGTVYPVQYGDNAGQAARHADSNGDFYGGRMGEENVNKTSYWLQKRVNGVYTVLDSYRYDPIGSPSGAVGKLECNGSTIKYYRDGTEKLSATDTSITGQLHVGMWMWKAGHRQGPWEGADLAAPPGPTGHPAMRRWGGVLHMPHGSGRRSW